MSKLLTSPLETATRKKIDQMLNNKGWLTDEFSDNYNVYTERVKTVEQTNKLKKISGYKKPPDYVLYKTNTDDPIAVIEAKRKGQNVDDALKTAIKKYAIPLGVEIVFAYDGTFFKSWHVGYNRALYVDDQVVSQLVTEKKIIQFLDEGYSITETTPKVIHSRSELISIFKQVNQLLRKEGLEEGKERFYEFANILFLKLISEIEEERSRNGEERIISEDFCWNKFNKLKAKEMYYYVNNTVLKELKDTYGEIFDEKLKIKETTLKTIVDKLSEITLMDIESDIKGDAFEYFLKTSITIGNDLGQYFTPRHVINLMINLIGPKYGEKIYDPTCGTGGFLISTFNYIKERTAKTGNVLENLKKETIWGRELTGIAKIAKMNMIITGDGHTNIDQLDALEHPIINKYDVVVANPPYGQSTDYGNLYKIPSGNGDVVFLQHIIDSLKDGDKNDECAGRAAVVIPEGVLFRSHADKKLRQWMLKNCDVEAIISLPQGVFRPYTKNKTNIIVFKKCKKGTKSIWFYDLTEDGFELNSDLRKPIDKNDIPDLLSKWTSKLESPNSWNVSIAKIQGNKYDLLAKTYRPKKEYSSNFPQIKFSNIMQENKDTTMIDDDKQYKRLTVKWYGNGVFLRDELLGKKIRAKKQKLVKANQFIVAEIDAKYGSFGIVPDDLSGAIVSSAYFVFDLDLNRVVPKYFDYLIRLGPYTTIIQQFVKGTTNRQRIKSQHILNLTIPLPPKEIQNYIVDRLNIQTNIIQHVQSTMDAVNDGITDISDFDGKYEYKNVQDVCSNICAGGTPSRGTPEYFAGSIPWLKISDMKRLDYTKTAKEKITEKAVFESSAKLILKGTVLFTIFATIGDVSILGAKKACTNQAIAGLVPKNDIEPKFLMYYLHTLKPHFKSKARGVTQNNINLQILKTTKIPVPPLAIQKVIVKQIDERKSMLNSFEKTKKNAHDTAQNIVNNLFKSE